jgi:hypothetical protein
MALHRTRAGRSGIDANAEQVRRGAHGAADPPQAKKCARSALQAPFGGLREAVGGLEDFGLWPGLERTPERPERACVSAEHPRWTTAYQFEVNCSAGTRRSSLGDGPGCFQARHSRPSDWVPRGSGLWGERAFPWGCRRGCPSVTFPLRAHWGEGRLWGCLSCVHVRVLRGGGQVVEIPTLLSGTRSGIRLLRT